MHRKRGIASAGRRAMSTLHDGSFGRLSPVEGDEDASVNWLIGYEQIVDARL
jgi:hypothetical protein